MLMRILQTRAANKTSGCKPKGRRNVRKSRQIHLEDIEKYFTELKMNRCRQKSNNVQECVQETKVL
jgi:hypothetical protein